MSDESERKTGLIPGRPGETLDSAPSPWIVVVAVPLGAFLGLAARYFCEWMGWR